MARARFARGLVTAFAATLLALTLIACGGGSGGKTDVGSIADPGVEVAPEDVLDPGPGEVEDECKCGNGACQAECGESLETCPCDCKVCEDGLCSPCEGPLSAPTDCCGTCGDGLCMGFDCGENSTVCPQDCGAKCGNGTCEKGENPYACPDDCKWQVCGNGVCEPSDGGFATCPDDCGPDCGDCTCGPSENWMQCPIDCGFCGDHVCSDCPKLLEGEDGCALDCSTDTCTPQAYKHCCGKDVCWFDTCDNAGDVVETCADSCASGACVMLPGALELSFANAVDDFGRPLADPTTVSYLVAGFTGTISLPVRATNDGVPVPGLVLSLAVTGGNGSLLGWEAEPVTTGADGTALLSVHAAIQATGSAVIDVCAQDHPEAACLAFGVFVASDGHVPLAVAVPAYGGAHDPADATVLSAYAFVHTTDNPMPCAALLATGALFDPDATATGGGLFDPLFFDDIPGLAPLEDTALTVVVEVRFGTPGMPGYGTARGCVDEGVLVSGLGASRFVEVAIADVPDVVSPLVGVGNWTLTSTLDLSQGLPAAIQEAVAEREADLLSPAVRALALYCTATGSDPSLQQLCALAFASKDDLSESGLTPAGQSLRTMIETNLSEALASACPFPMEPSKCKAPWLTATDLDGLLSAIRLGGLLKMITVPGTDGVYPPGGLVLTWNTLSLHWSFGQVCPAGDPECGWWTKSIAAAPGWAGETSVVVPGSVSAGGVVTIDPHAWSADLGRVLSAILEWTAARMVGGDLDQGWAFFLMRLHGGASCGTEAECCKKFGDRVAMDAPAIGGTLASAACNALLMTAPGFLRQGVVAMDDDAKTTLALPGCPLIDTNADQQYDRLGSPESPCAWDATVHAPAGEFAPAFEVFGFACGDSCSLCVPDDHKACCGNAICWYDSCGNVGGQVAACTAGCEAGQCVVTPAPITMSYVFPAGDGKDDVGKVLASALAPGFNLVVPDGGKVTLRIQMTGDPVVLAPLQINLLQVAGRENLVGPTSLITSPDASGLVSFPLEVIGEGPGFVQYRASIGGMPEVPDLIFNVFVSPTGLAPLAAGIRPYAGAGKVSDLRSIRVLAFPHQGDMLFPCSEVVSQIGNLEEYHVTELSAFDQTAFFADFPEATGGAVDLTVLAYAEFGTATGALTGRAAGCIDQGVTVSAGPSRYLEIGLADLSPSLPSGWSIVHDLDLYQALPGEQKAATDRMITFAVDPASQILMWYCWAPDTTGLLGNYCNLLFKNPASPNPGELTAGGLAVRTLLDEHFTSLRLASCPYADPKACATVYYQPADLSLALSRIRLEGSLSFVAPPGSDGVLAAGSISSYWMSASFPWSFGSDIGEVRVPVTLGMMDGWPPNHMTSASGFLAQNGALTIDSHAWSTGFGALAWSFFDDVVAPRVFGDPSGEGLAWVLRTLHGGAGCSDPGACCLAFGDALLQLDQTVGGTMAAGACNLLLANAPAAMREPLARLDTADGVTTLATAEPCVLLDNDGNWTYDALGTAEQPCKWSVKAQFSGNTMTPAMTFHATSYY